MEKKTLGSVRESVLPLPTNEQCQYDYDSGSITGDYYPVPSGLKSESCWYGDEFVEY